MIKSRPRSEVRAFGEREGSRLTDKREKGGDRRFCSTDVEESEDAKYITEKQKDNCTGNCTIVLLHSSKQVLIMFPYTTSIYNSRESQAYRDRRTILSTVCLFTIKVFTQNLQKPEAQRTDHFRAVGPDKDLLEMFLLDNLKHFGKPRKQSY